MIMTEDDEPYAIPISPASITAVVALATANTTLVWDPTNRTLIAAKIVGTMPWSVRDDTA